METIQRETQSMRISSPCDERRDSGDPWPFLKLEKLNALDKVIVATGPRKRCTVPISLILTLPSHIASLQLFAKLHSQ